MSSYSKVVRRIEGKVLSEGDKNILAEVLWKLAKDVTEQHDRVIFARVCLCVCSGEHAQHHLLATDLSLVALFLIHFVHM